MSLTVSTFSLFETNKLQRQQLVQEIVQRIEDGEISALKIHLQLKSISDVIDQITSTDEKKNKSFEIAKRYKKALITEASNYGKSFELHNAKFETKEVGTQYDFSVCGDDEYLDLCDKLAEAKEQVKNRETFLKSIPAKGVVVTNEETGETKTLYQPTKSSTTSLAVTLK